MNSKDVRGSRKKSLHVTRGAGSLLELSPSRATLATQLGILPGRNSDGEQLASDWEAVGKDLRSSMDEQAERTESCKK
jgi:hypothetical protein